MKSEFSIMAECFKALGDENRLKLLEALGGGEMFAGELLDKLSIAQPTLSHHMKILCDSGIVESRREGKWIYYKISKEGKAELISYLEKITSGVEIKNITVLSNKVRETLEKPRKKAVKPKKEDIIKEVIDGIKETEDIIQPIEEVIAEKEITVIEEKEEKNQDRSMPSWLF